MILDEDLDKRYTENFRKPQYRALTTGTAGHNKSAVHWVYGIPCILPNANGKYPGKVNTIRTANGSIYPIKPDTLSEYTGCEDCKGQPIYEGDIICKNRSYIRWVQYNEKYSAYITVRKGGNGDYNADYLAKGDSLCRNIEIIGNIWQNPKLLKQRCYTTYSLEEVYND
mgnify:CR=1 FL=1